MAEGRTVQVMYDYTARTTRPIDEDLKAAIREFEKREIPSRA